MARSSAATPEDYLAELSPERRAEMSAVRDLVNAAIAHGYVERMAWGMINWEVPLEVSGPTYNHQPLSYVALAAQKNYFALYLNGLEAGDPREAQLRAAFDRAGKKCDMGKSCLRFRAASELPAAAIAEVIASTSVEQYVARYREARGAKC